LNVNFVCYLAQQALYALEYGVFVLSLLLALSSSRHSDGMEANMGRASAREIVLPQQDDGMNSVRGRTHGIERNESHDYEYS